MFAIYNVSFFPEIKPIVNTINSFQKHINAYTLLIPPYYSCVLN